MAMRRVIIQLACIHINVVINRPIDFQKLVSVMLSLTEIGCHAQKLYLDSRRETGSSTTKAKSFQKSGKINKRPSFTQIHLHVLSRNGLHFIRSLSGEFLSSPWEQALIRDSCNYWLLWCEAQKLGVGRVFLTISLQEKYESAA